MKKQQNKHSSLTCRDQVPSRVVLGLLACSVLALTATPARAQYASSPMMAYTMMRSVPMMGSTLIRGLLPHGGHKNKNNNANNNNNTNTNTNTNGTAQVPAGGTAQAGQYYPGANGQIGYGVPGQASAAAPYAQPNYGNMQAQGYPVQGVQNVPNVQNVQNVQNLQTAQMGYNNAPGLTQGSQNSFGTVQGQMYSAPGQAAYGAQSAPGMYGPTAGQ